MINYIFAPTHLNRFDALAIALMAYVYGTGKINEWVFIAGLLIAVTLSGGSVEGVGGCLSN